MLSSKFSARQCLFNFVPCVASLACSLCPAFAESTIVPCAVSESAECSGAVQGIINCFAFRSWLQDEKTHSLDFLSKSVASPHVDLHSDVFGLKCCRKCWQSWVRSCGRVQHSESLEITLLFPVRWCSYESVVSLWERAPWHWNVGIRRRVAHMLLHPILCCSLYHYFEAVCTLRSRQSGLILKLAWTAT